jgi:hypothetical protein
VFTVAVVDDERDLVEAVGVTVSLELVSDSLGEIVESSVRW